MHFPGLMTTTKIFQLRIHKQLITYKIPENTVIAIMLT